MIFKNCTFFNEEFNKEFGDIEIEDGVIKRIGIINEDGIDKSGEILIPGFVDAHIHGSNGGDCSDADVDALNKISEGLAKNGITSFCATTMTLSNEKLKNICQTIADFKSPKSKIVGINLEGPYISMAKKGAQNGDYIRKAEIDEIRELNKIANNKIKLITIAPEEVDDSFYELKNEVNISIGHTSANGEETKKAISLGANHATHLFNAMTPMTHRESGVVGECLDSDVYCELICDLVHICPTVLRNAFKILGEDRAVIVSDSCRAAGLGLGQYELGGQDIFVKDIHKTAVLEDGTIAASITNIYQELKNLLSIGIDFKTALKSATINPAKSIGLDNEIGSIAIGKKADLVFLDEKLDIKEVYIDGILA